MRQALDGNLVVAKGMEVQGPLGSSAVDLMVDTGAQATFLSRALLESLGYSVQDSATKRRVLTGNGLIEVPVITVQALKLDDCTVGSLDVCAYSIPQLTHLSGLLGLDFLRQFRMVIDFHEAYWTLEPHASLE